MAKAPPTVTPRRGQREGASMLSPLRGSEEGRREAGFVEIVYVDDVVANLIAVGRDPLLQKSQVRGLLWQWTAPARSTQVRLVDFSLSKGHEFDSSRGG